MQEKIVIFGCGKIGRETADSLNYFNITNYCFTDNNKLLWGSKINGKVVIQPDEICNIECIVVVAIADCVDILAQLNGYKTNNRIIFVRELDLLLCEKLVEKFKDTYAEPHSKEVIIFESLNNEFWGGGEKWSYILSKELADLNYNVHLFANDKQENHIDIANMNVELIEYNPTIKWKVIESLVKKMLKSFVPCKIFCNVMSSFFLVAYILKQLLPSYISIIVVQHSDKAYHYNTSKSSEGYLDKIICVSKKINSTLSTFYNVKHTKLLYKENFTQFNNINLKGINYDTSLKICYLGRIETKAKRLDLLPKFITELEKINKNYVLSIAGKGSHVETLKKFICDENLGRKIIFKGFLFGEDIEKFLSSQDVFFSCSDYEGSSLSMIEAMGFGVVPVVTNVSGVDEFVEDGKNGYTAQVGDVKKLAIAVDKLECNRHTLHEFSLKSQQIVNEKCTLKSYVDFIEMLLMIKGEQ